VDPANATRTVLGFEIYRFRVPLRRRMLQLFPGLWLFGFALSLTVEAKLGTNPWTVFSQGVGQKLGLSIGTVVILTGLMLIVVFRFIAEPIGFGTVANAALVGLAIDTSLRAIPDVNAMWLRILLLALSPAILGVASGLYLGAGLGPGPRDGLMTAMSGRGLSVSWSRTIIELTALGIGWLLGGDVGIGTVWFGVTVGWWVKVFLKPFQIDNDNG